MPNGFNIRTKLNRELRRDAEQTETEHIAAQRRIEGRMAEAQYRQARRVRWSIWLDGALSGASIVGLAAALLALFV